MERDDECGFFPFEDFLEERARSGGGPSVSPLKRWSPLARTADKRRG